MNKNSKNFYCQIIFLLCIFLFTTYCVPKPITTNSPSLYGCNEPNPDVFLSAGVDLQFAKSTFNRIITGDIDIKTYPNVISLASKAVIDERIRSYLRCLSIRRDGFTLEQAAYFDDLAAFMKTDPSPEQFLKWKEGNIFPNSNSKLDRLQNNLKKKEKINITRNEIIQSLKNAKTELQKQNLAKKLYYGKYVKWTGKIQYIYADSDNKVVIMWPHGYAICDNSEVMSSLQEGMIVTLLGKITWYQETLITIENCELLEVKK